MFQLLLNVMGEAFVDGRSGRAAARPRQGRGSTRFAPQAALRLGHTVTILRARHMEPVVPGARYRFPPGGGATAMLALLRVRFLLEGKGADRPPRYGAN
ncbi:protein of unknown function [Bradyrhizobium sp. ORS 285]|nr:hypothetical protein BRAO285_1260004 [Bradyrhizobium sp. ORS 285]SMX56403.1 protein of unknown function [Bradyrhizobium sp. ORS 285]